MRTIKQMGAGAAYREADSVHPFVKREDRALSLEIQNARVTSGLFGPAPALSADGLDRSTTNPPDSLESPELRTLPRATKNGGCKGDSNGGFERWCDREVEDDATLCS
jgi:hypothetical protein